MSPFWLTLLGLLCLTVSLSVLGVWAAKGMRKWWARRARTSLATPDAPQTLAELQRRSAMLAASEYNLDSYEMRRRINAIQAERRKEA